MYGQPYEVIPIAKEFLSRFPHYAERSVYMTEGGVDVYRASDLYVSEKARNIAPAKVVGTYGSEIIRHAVMFKATSPPDGLFRPEFTKDIRQAAETYSALRSQHPVTFAAFSQSPWYHQGILALESSQLTVRSPYLDSDFVRTVFRGPQMQRVKPGHPLAANSRMGIQRWRSSPRTAESAAFRTFLPNLPRSAGVHVQSRVCIRLRHAAVGLAHRFLACPRFISNAFFWGGTKSLIFASGIETLCLNTCERCCSTGELSPALL